MSAVLSPLAAGDAKLDACPKCGAHADGIWFRSSQVCALCENKRVLEKVQQQDRDQITELANLLASADTILRIERLCIVTAGGWFDPQFAIATPGPETDMLRLGIKYLAMRDLIDFNPAFPTLFRLVVSAA